MSPDYHAPVNSQTVFRNDIFKGKVLFCTGGEYIHDISSRAFAELTLARRQWYLLWTN